MRHCSDGWVAFHSLLTIPVCAVLPFFILLFAEYTYECNTKCQEKARRQEDAQNLVVYTWMLPVGVGSVFFIIVPPSFMYQQSI
jgi:hypothetical protein